MENLAWVTDSTAILDDELASRADIFTIPMSVILDGKEFTDGIDLTAGELFHRLKTLNEPPKTSQPSVGAFKTLYEKLFQDYDHVISILVSSKLSGTIDSSQQAAKLLNKPVVTIDSKILSFPQSALIKKGIQLAGKGASIPEIKSTLEKIRESSETYVLVGSLEQLHRSGRMSGAKYLFGSMLNIKPIISIVDGALEVKDKARSGKKAKEKIFDCFRASYREYGMREAWLLYGHEPNIALQWLKELQTEFTEVAFSCFPLGAVIGVHAGEHTIGISWYNQSL
ncbi:DegV family protein [Bacillus sp. FJAT-27251]|uniref:DegV family protein n=1 Tax=Bacillus sp. FJAT-27251 TaxID=1684142 RepID=UPI0006A7D1D8|nr:DegV family protein [Bacillus sp. FJAT-27251]